MLFAKHCITSSAGLLGGVFGYVTADSDVAALLSAFGFMLACAAMADFLTVQLEEDEDDDNEDADGHS
jgi:hypothetical protein